MGQIVEGPAYYAKFEIISPFLLAGKRHTGCRHGSKRVRFAFGRVFVNGGGLPGVVARVTGVVARVTRVVARVTRVGEQKTRNPLTEVNAACPAVNHRGEGGDRPDGGSEGLDVRNKVSNGFLRT